MKNLLENQILNKVLYGLYILVLFVLILDYGFKLPSWVIQTILYYYILLLIIAVLITTSKYIVLKKKLVPKVFIFDLLSVLFVLYCIYKQLNISTTQIVDWIRFAIIIKLIREFATPKINYKRSILNPAQLFIISFMGLVLIGALLLMLPNATYNGISFIDALFTSTSAVCVTGLTVVNTSSFFTPFGQSLIMFLIQVGGLGILTFASYFSYFFKGGATYENQIALSDISSPNKIGEVFTTLKRILGITFLIEFLGAFFIYINISEELIPSSFDRIFFSAFHSISAFCNAGFSTLPHGMMQDGFINNYSLQFIIIIIFVFGGLGFPIVINVLRYLKYFVKRYLLWFTSRKDNYKPWVLTLNSKINLITTISLIILGTVIIYSKEFYNTLNTHDGIGKLITALFTATTPRTAGFNSIDFSELHFSSIIVIIVLMWIGASPASTGGGIKTSTFAIAILNFLSLAKGKEKIEIWKREIANISVRRAFATMTLSLVVIGFGMFLISYYDSHLKLLEIAFECFSAYSTVGLSLGITGDLSAESKLVLIVIMFIGRVTMLSILIAVFKKVKTLNYRYPTDEILIN